MIIREMILLGSNSSLSLNPYLYAYLSGWTSFGDLPNTWLKWAQLNLKLSQTVAMAAAAAAVAAAAAELSM